MASCYLRMIPDEDSECRCSNVIQTHNHILLHCPMYEAYRDLLRDDRDQVHIAALLGSEKGITKRLASCIAATGAFSKPPATMQ